MADLEMSRSDLLYALDILQPTLTSNLVLKADVWTVIERESENNHQNQNELLYWSIFTLHQNFIRFYVLNETAVYLYIWMAYFLSSDFTVVLGQTTNSDIKFGIEGRCLNCNWTGVWKWTLFSQFLFINKIK
jgi:hypothetical protein